MTKMLPTFRKGGAVELINGEVGAFVGLLDQQFRPPQLSTGPLARAPLAIVLTTTGQLVVACPNAIVNLDPRSQVGLPYPDARTVVDTMAVWLNQQQRQGEGDGPVWGEVLPGLYGLEMPDEPTDRQGAILYDLCEEVGSEVVPPAAAVQPPAVARQTKVVERAQRNLEEAAIHTRTDRQQVKCLSERENRYTTPHVLDVLVSVCPCRS